MNSNRLFWALLSLFGLLSPTPCAAQPLCAVLLKPAFTYSANGLVVQLEDSSRTFGIQATATWDFGDGSAVTADAVHFYQGPGIYNVCLTLTALDLPCAVTNCRSVVVVASNCAVPVNAYFEWSLAGTNAAMFYDATQPLEAANTLWDFGDGVTDQSNAPSHTWFLPGAHFVSLTKWNDSCATTHGEWVAVDGNVTTCAPPGLFLDFEPNYTGDGVEFVPEIVTNDVVPVFYIWSYGDGVIDTTYYGYHVYPDAGPYQACCLLGAVTAPALDSCFALTCRTIYPYSATEVLELSDEVISIAPNPFTESLRIDLGTDAESTFIQMMDMVGRTVLSIKVQGTRNVQVQTGHLLPGPYLMVISGPTKVRRTKVIKSSQ